MSGQKPNRFEWMKDRLYSLGYQDENLYSWFEGEDILDPGLYHDLDTLGSDFTALFGEGEGEDDEPE